MADFDKMSNEELQEAFSKMNRGDESIEFIDDLETPIEFGCNRCGGCCTGRDDILLSPYDIWNIAQATGETGHDIIENYCTIHIGCNSNLPIVSLKPDERNLCPFMELDTSTCMYKCKINANKPGACELHPFGVAYGINPQTEERNVRFIKTKTCSNNNHNMIKPQDFLQHYIDNIDKRFISTDLQQLLSSFVNLDKFACISAGELNDFTDKEKQKLEPLMSEGVRKSMWQSICIAYIDTVYNFDMSLPFNEETKELVIKSFVNAIFPITVIFEILEVNIKGAKYEKYCEEYLDEETQKKVLDDMMNSVDKKLKEELEKSDSDE